LLLREVCEVHAMLEQPRSYQELLLPRGLITSHYRPLYSEGCPE
jgi:hypothetical protein